MAPPSHLAWSLVWARLRPCPPPSMRPELPMAPALDLIFPRWVETVFLSAYSCFHSSLFLGHFLLPNFFPVALFPIQLRTKGHTTLQPRSTPLWPLPINSKTFQSEIKYYNIRLPYLFTSYKGLPCGYNDSSSPFHTTDASALRSLPSVCLCCSMRNYYNGCLEA